MRYSPVADQLIKFSSDLSDASLLGSQCADCDEHFFPNTPACARCSSDNMLPANLGNRGRLWTWTIQRMMPKPPYQMDETLETFKPFGVGYVEMPSGVRVESRLLFDAVEDLEIDGEMTLVLIPMRVADDGSTVVTFAFKPAKMSARND